jgi:mono/diheme cytochrome c family protein
VATWSRAIVPYDPAPLMSARRTRIVLGPLAVLAAVGVVACGEQKISLDDQANEQVAHGAAIFHERCAGCHTLSYGAAEGSAIKPNDKEYKDGPNFDQRREDEQSVLFAIENGGFSSGPMPQDIVVGQDAKDVAAFLAQYSGRKAPKTVSP